MGRDDSGGAREKGLEADMRDPGHQHPCMSSQPTVLQPWKGLSRESAFQKEPVANVWGMNEGEKSGGRGAPCRRLWQVTRRDEQRHLGTWLTLEGRGGNVLKVGATRLKPAESC